MSTKKAPPDGERKNADVIEIAAYRAPGSTTAGARDSLRALELAADRVAQSPRGFERQVARLVEAALARGVSYEALRLATLRLELSAQGRPYSAFSSRAALPENAGVDERLREADRLVREAASPLPARLPAEGYMRPVLRVCEAGWIAGPNALPGAREDLFRRWLAQTECDLARRIATTALETLCDAFAADRVKWKLVTPELSKLGFAVDLDVLKHRWPQHKAALIRRSAKKGEPTGSST